ncbi:hypothetical protein TrLO_g4798 [Triparma laevis f. longispina]|uniref:AB hydrolase-1 domain-containing protein n=1 Tax=Triparma laevis f. longispina TaxID=1714387 RepID=A0A9W7AS80_9STRA|nr:hypothetical protein TrLO_g4798 [Triparma laevis f. longispina]
MIWSLDSLSSCEVGNLTSGRLSSFWTLVMGIMSLEKAMATIPQSKAALAFIISSVLITVSVNSLLDSPPAPLAYYFIDKTLELGLRAITGVKDEIVQTSYGESRVMSIDCPNRNPTSPRLVLLHGVTSKSADLLPVALSLKIQGSFSRIVLIDLQGHGLSDMCDDDTEFTFDGMTDMALETFDAIFPNDDGEVVLAGNSLGGLILFQIGLRGRKNPLYLISPGGAPSTASELSSLSSTFELKTHSSARRFFRTMLSEKRYKPSLLIWIMAFGCLHRTSSKNVKRIFKALLNPTESACNHDMSKFVAPCGIFWGKEERLLPSSNLEYFKKKIGKKHLIQVDEPDYFGHVPFFDNPYEVAQYISRFAELAVKNKSKK